MAPQLKVEPVIASDATDGLGQMELPIAEAMRDADCLSYEARDACIDIGSVDSQAQRSDFWSTSRGGGPTATVSYRRRRRYTAPDASTEKAAGEPMGVTESESLMESGSPEAPLEAAPSEATFESVPEVPVEVLDTAEPTEIFSRDGLTESHAPVAPRYATAREAAPEATRAPKRGRKPRALAEVAAPEVTTQKGPTRKRGRKAKALIETAAPKASPEERQTPKRGPNPIILTEVAGAGVTNQETPTRKHVPKQITPPGGEAASQARTHQTPTRKARQKQKAPIAIQRPSISSLLAQLASINAQLERLRATEVPRVVAEIQQLMQEYDLSVDDIARKPKVEAAARAVPAAAKAAPLPRYRDPKTGRTWSGRGRAPAWLGKKPERFLIDRLY
ncbi:hypothetical protein D9X30_2957 (plasmid) [Cupriavidus sp. U2]|nr:hypothetical protein D9X30_2957 [Cupriavidus sp. U2]